MVLALEAEEALRYQNEGSDKYWENFPTVEHAVEAALTISMAKYAGFIRTTALNWFLTNNDTAKKTIGKARETAIGSTTGG